MIGVNILPIFHSYRITNQLLNWWIYVDGRLHKFNDWSIKFVKEYEKNIKKLLTPYKIFYQSYKYIIKVSCIYWELGFN